MLHIAGWTLCVGALRVCVATGLTLREEFMGRVTERAEGGHAHGLVGVLMFSATGADSARSVRMGSVRDPGHMVLVCVSEHMLVGTFFTLEAFMLFL